MWHVLTGDHGKPAKPMFLKAHLWKNAFHVFEQRMDVIHIVPRALQEGLTR